MRRLFPALVLSAALLAGCTDPYGRVDLGRTALLGVGVGAAAALTAGALSDKPRPYRGNRRGYYGDGGYDYGAASRPYGYGGGYGAASRPYGYGGGYGAASRPYGYGGGYGYGAPVRGYGGYGGGGYGPRGGYYGGW